MESKATIWKVKIYSILNNLNFNFCFLDPDGFEFYIVSLDNKQWHFEAATTEERDEWVKIIEQEIFKSLQGNDSGKPKSQNSSDVAQLMQNIKTQVAGNNFCVDCDSENPEWASLNLGVLMCIECSGKIKILT